MAFVIHVDFAIKPEGRERFRELIVENATRSREDEPGCRQFDVTQDPKNPNRIVLYEVYDDRAAFDAHVASSHYALFDEASSGLVTSKLVTVLERIDPACD
ncbi:putative quinol monooxygenase [Marinivivus vitaminiproducens]|uniref:putative quinol monooxygenase n=1 Tax=Marinivivus vitaminiproducens TaxID=3035935 RepID=UPI0027A9FA72|nr:putative quinol monooxygenase [Geminicoccaceae bacterium SCSIO 64248]